MDSDRCFATAQHRQVMRDVRQKDKIMNPEIHSIVKDMKKHCQKDPIAETDRQTYLMVQSSRLSVLLAEEAEKSTKKIVYLTWALFGLTAVLLVVSIVQIVILK